MIRKGTSGTMKKINEFRLYSFGNYYISSIGQGIQALHATVEMFMKAKNGEFTNFTKDMLYEWAESHKTAILLNGGNSAELKKLVNILKLPDNPYPWASFHEEKTALNSALTSVVIVIPEWMFNRDLDTILEQDGPLTPFTRRFLEFKDACSLAR